MSYDLSQLRRIRSGRFRILHRLRRVYSAPRHTARRRRPGGGSAGCSYCYVHQAPTYSAIVDLDIGPVDLSTNSSYTIATGTVTNNGSHTYTFVKVKGTFEDSSGTVVDTDWTYVVGSEGLAPGETKSYRLSVPKDYTIRSCTVSILDYD